VILDVRLGVFAESNWAARESVEYAGLLPTF